jgi:hypothetical protein
LVVLTVVIGLLLSLTGCSEFEIEHDIVKPISNEDEVVSEPVAKKVIRESAAEVEEAEPKPTGKHEHGKIFSFQPKGSTAYDYVKPWCKSRECVYPGYSLFRGTPSDTSYLDVIGEHIDSDEIIGGEYYTVTATVTLADYDFARTRLGCKVQNDDIIVYFSVDFREEFEDAVGLLEEGDEVTFRGRFYDVGCGWEDCELIK